MADAVQLDGDDDLPGSHLGTVEGEAHHSLLDEVDVQMLLLQNYRPY